MPVLAGLAACLVSGAVQAQAGGPAQGRLEYESRQVSSDGVEKQQRFSERWLRSEGHVWTERLLPKARMHPAADAHGHAEAGSPRLHPSDLAAASKHVWVDSKGQVQLALVRSDLRTVIRAEPRDFGQLGFDGRFAPAWSLIDPEQLRGLKPRPPAAGDAADTVWYERRQGGQFLRVLWSERMKLALQVEAGTEDGSQWSRTQLKLDPQPIKSSPWNQLNSYRQIDYVDLLD